MIFIHLFFILASLCDILMFSHSFQFPNMLTKLSSYPHFNKRLFSLSTISSNSDATRPYKMNFYSVSEEELISILKTWNIPKFRANQIRSWVYEKGIVDFSQMKNIPESLRKNLEDYFQMGTLTVAKHLSSKDGTQKLAYQLPDGQLIESVLMPYDDGRRTACISSQAGCGMGCVFCATGQMGFSRQLTSAEIFEQAQIFSSQLIPKGERLSNIVFMGMGEPLANYDNVLSAIHRLNTELGIGARHITVSTVGIAPRIRKLADEPIQISLAISLHQATDEKRSKLMPVNQRFPISELIDACRYYIEKTNRRVSFEWALIQGETDTIESAHELGKLLKGLLCHVNVIPLNPTKGFSGRPTDRSGVLNFIDILKTYGVTATPRMKRGVDIDAGCGQLKSDLLRKQKAVNETNNP